MIESSQPSRHAHLRPMRVAAPSRRPEDVSAGRNTGDGNYATTGPPDGAVENADFHELKRRIEARGLLAKQHGYYALKMLQLVGLLGAGLLALAFIDHWWLVLVDAVFLAFVATQIGFIGHDAGHKQLFRSATLNDVAGLIFGNLLLGVSRQWWIDKHNQHHKNPNQMDVDPDMAVLFFLPNGLEVEKKTGMMGFIWRHPALFIFPLTVLGALNLKARGIPYLLSTNARYKFAEVFLIAIHIVLFVSIPVYFLSLGQALAFLLVNLALSGIYMASVFATNHIGMPVLESGMQIDFMHRQTLTSRDVRAPRGTDFLCGGLNYQIEHHLFPTMARNRLNEAQHIVRAFCRERSIPYHEVSVGDGYGEILRFFGNAGKQVRRLTAIQSR